LHYLIELLSQEFGILADWQPVPPQASGSLGINEYLSEARVVPGGWPIGVNNTRLPARSDRTRSKPKQDRMSNTDSHTPIKYISHYACTLNS
jgi:hypothetical protein